MEIKSMRKVLMLSDKEKDVLMQIKKFTDTFSKATNLCENFSCTDCPLHPFCFADKVSDKEALEKIIDKLESHINND